MANAPFTLPVTIETTKQADHFILVDADKETVADLWSTTRPEAEFIVESINMRLGT